MGNQFNRDVVVDLHREWELMDLLALQPYYLLGLSPVDAIVVACLNEMQKGVRGATIEVLAEEMKEENYWEYWERTTNALAEVGAGALTYRDAAVLAAQDTARMIRSGLDIPQGFDELAQLHAYTDFDILSPFAELWARVQRGRETVSSLEVSAEHALSALEALLIDRNTPFFDVTPAFVRAARKRESWSSDTMDQLTAWLRAQFPGTSSGGASGGDWHFESIVTLAEQGIGGAPGVLEQSEDSCRYVQVGILRNDIPLLYSVPDAPSHILNAIARAGVIVCRVPSAEEPILGLDPEAFRGTFVEMTRGFGYRTDWNAVAAGLLRQGLDLKGVEWELAKWP